MNDNKDIWCRKGIGSERKIEINNNQWETDGKCPECSRKATCTKACDAHKKRVRGEE